MQFLTWGKNAPHSGVNSTILILRNKNQSDTYQSNAKKWFLVLRGAPQKKKKKKLDLHYVFYTSNLPCILPFLLLLELKKKELENFYVS